MEKVTNLVKKNGMYFSFFFFWREIVPLDYGTMHNIISTIYNVWFLFFGHEYNLL